MKEVCSCGAKFAIDMPALPLPDIHWAKGLEMLEKWRREHLHEFAPEPEGPPTILESGSSHERLGEYMSTENDIPFGFTRNEVP